MHAFEKSFPNLHSRHPPVLSEPCVDYALRMPTGAAGFSCLLTEMDFLACCQKFPTIVQDRVPWDFFLTWRKSGERFFCYRNGCSWEKIFWQPGNNHIMIRSEMTGIYVTYDMHWYAKICYATPSDVTISYILCYATGYAILYSTWMMRKMDQISICHKWYVTYDILIYIRYMLCSASCFANVCEANVSSCTQSNVELQIKRVFCVCRAAAPRTQDSKNNAPVVRSKVSRFSMTMWQNEALMLRQLPFLMADAQRSEDRSVF